MDFTFNSWNLITRRSSVSPSQNLTMSAWEECSLKDYMEMAVSTIVTSDFVDYEAM